MMLSLWQVSVVCVHLNATLFLVSFDTIITRNENGNCFDGLKQCIADSCCCCCWRAGRLKKTTFTDIDEVREFTSTGTIVAEFEEPTKRFDTFGRYYCCC